MLGCGAVPTVYQIKLALSKGLGRQSECLSPFILDVEGDGTHLLIIDGSVFGLLTVGEERHLGFSLDNHLLHVLEELLLLCTDLVESLHL